MPCSGYYSTTADQVRSLKAKLKEGMAGFEAVGRFLQMVDNLVEEFNQISDGSTIKTDPGMQTGALALVGAIGTGTKMHAEHGGALTAPFEVKTEFLSLLKLFCCKLFCCCCCKLQFCCKLFCCCSSCHSVCFI